MTKQRPQSQRSQQPWTSENHPFPDTQDDTLPARLSKNRIEVVLDKVDAVGKWLFGDFWRTVYLTAQDAISLILILKISSFIFGVFGEDYSSFAKCYEKDPSDTEFYACFIAVLSDFGFLIIFSVRAAFRLIQDFCEVFRSKGRLK